MCKNRIQETIVRQLLRLFLIATVVGCGTEEQPLTSQKPTTPAATAEKGASEDQYSSNPEDLQLNELLASNQGNSADDLGNNSDWLEVYNAGTNTLRLDGYHLTDDLEVLDKWSLPSHRIPADGYQVVWMSGLDRNSLAPEALKTSAANVPFQATLVKSGADWKYLYNRADKKDANQGINLTGWTDVEFDDSSFAVGPAGFGYGDEDDATMLPPKTTVVLMRHEFTIEDPLYSSSLVLQVDYDDGFAAYLNGIRVAAVNTPQEDPGLDSVATGSHEAGTSERFDLSAHVGLLRRGKNVLAIAGLNTHPGSSDLSIKPSLGTLRPIFHASFRLNKKGGNLYLVAPDGKIVDQIEYPRQRADQSLGRIDANSSTWGYFLKPTPGSTNKGPAQETPIKSRISFSPEPGAYPEGVEVEISQESWEATDIRFTLDGSPPNGTSPLYEQPVPVTDTSLLRAASFVGEERASPIVSATYLAGHIPSLPVMSISLKPEEFVDIHLQQSGKGRGSERQAFLELFTPAGERAVATGFGMRLHGGAGRRGGLEIKKSYRVYFRKSYGKGRVDYPIIPTAEIEDFDKLVLRANFGDGRAHGSYIRDQMIRDLHSEMGGMASNGSWYVVLINGKSHGLYNVVERMDEEYFISHLGPGQYDVIKTGNTVLSGTRQNWDQLRDFISSTDFSNEENYQQLARRVDIENFTAYMIVNLWVLNLDWPHNNWYAARRIPDGKWIFLCWDSEWGLAGGPYGPEVDPYSFIDSGGAYGHGMSRKLFFALLGNPGYREYYQQQVRKYLNGPLSSANALRQAHHHRDIVVADIEHEFETRGYGKERWHEQIKEIEEFCKNAGDYFQRHTDQYFAHKPSPTIEDRLTLTQDAEGSRHVIYRTAKGQLHELASTADASTWNRTTISFPGTAPPAAGQPSHYTLAEGQQQVLYRGQDSHLHLLSKPAADVNDDPWQHTDLTAQLEIPIAASDPSAVVVDGVPHVVYVDQDSRIRELWFDGTWHHYPLPALPRTDGDAIISRDQSTLYVTYRTMFGAPCEQRLSLQDIQPGRRPWIPRLIYRLPAAGQPVGYNAGGKRHVVFWAAEKWPHDDPFYFDGIERRQPDYRRYDGPRNTLVHAWDKGERFRRLYQIGNPPNPVVGSPCLVHDVQADQYHVAYRNAEGHIQEATFQNQQGSWRLIDATALAWAPPAAGEPSGLLSTQTGARYYVYRSQDGHLHELCFDGQWNHRDLGEIDK